MISLKQILLEGSGDCYQAAVNVLMKNMDKGILVHGMVNGQGRLEGVRFGHAWVEVGNKVLDYSNGNKITLPKRAYYGLGKVNPKECKYYKYREAAEFMLDKGHYGPWEMTGNTVMAEDIPDNKREIGKRKVRVSKDVLNNLGESIINEIPMVDLQKIDKFADKKLNPVDVVLTDKHFFDRLNDPRNGKEISNAELIGFFKRLSKKKKEFLDFLDRYKQVVASDDRTNINIPFMKQANKVIAKTVMRKKDFKTPNQKLDI